MPLDPDDVAEAQYDTVRRLLPYVAVPLAGDLYVRGVLPVTRPEPALRVVLGGLGEYDVAAYVAYEVPLRDGESVRSAGAILRAVVRSSTGTRLYGASDVGTVLGMTVVSVKPEQWEAGADSYEERAGEFLHALLEPYVEEPPSPGVRGFLFTGPERMRIYAAGGDTHEVIGADVKVSDRMTALLSALPSLVEEPERQRDSDDPHCARLVDLLRW
ncbi:hypothetical protein ABZV64_05710 [Streptomyces sp. NPDC004959]|uniref:hypothetical protein n=1 Tax=unclassified Streptomyces TaxID=2593676 RepID=UPI0033B5CDB8